MRGILRFSVVAAMLALSWGTSSQAQSIPPGSYQQTCKNIDMRNDVLSANCQDSGGHWQSALLRDVGNCRSDIINDDGALRCSRGVGIQSQAGVPGGSYSQSCQEMRVHGDDLEARCQNTNGDWKSTKLDDYNKCHGDIINDNGKLRCVAGAYNPPGAYQGGYNGVAAGAYTQTCKDIKSHGDDLEARCKTVNGDWHNTKLDDYRKCKGQIVNEDGNLKCVAGDYAGIGRPGYPAGSYQGNLPAGSYTQSCDGIRVHGDDLEAHCQTRDGGSRDAKLDDFQKCKSEIINDDGKLRCEK